MGTKFTGKYQMLSFEKPDAAIDEEEYRQISENIQIMTVYAEVNAFELSNIEFFSNNKIAVKLVGEEDVVWGSYTLEENSIKIVDNEGEEIATFSIDDDLLVLEHPSVKLIYGNTPPPVKNEMNSDKKFIGKYYTLAVEKAYDSTSDEDFKEFQDMIDMFTEQTGTKAYELNTLEFFEDNRIKANFMGSAEVEGKYVVKGNTIYAFEDDGYSIALLNIESDTLSMIRRSTKLIFCATQPQP